MPRISLALILASAALMPIARVDAAAVNEVEPDNFLFQAQNVDGLFSSDFNADITDSMGNNTSTTIPHVSISGRGDNGPLGLGLDHDYFSFTVPFAGQQGIFDIDSSAPLSNLSLYLFDTAGQLLAENHSLASLGAAMPDSGSLSLDDPFLEYTFADAGLYYIGVGGAGSIGQDGGILGLGPAPLDLYTLHASVAVPEPGVVILFGVGAAGLLISRRRRRSTAPSGGDDAPAAAGR